MDSPSNLEDGKTWVRKTNKELAGEPAQLWGGRTQLKFSWDMLPAAHVATKSRLWWWQWVMGMLFLESLSRENDPKERKLTPSIDSPQHFLWTAWKVLETYQWVSSGCRRRCLRDLLSKWFARYSCLLGHHSWDVSCFWGCCILTFHLQPGKGAVSELCQSLHPS